MLRKCLVIFDVGVKEGVVPAWKNAHCGREATAKRAAHIDVRSAGAGRAMRVRAARSMVAVQNNNGRSGPTRVIKGRPESSKSWWTRLRIFVICRFAVARRLSAMKWSTLNHTLLLRHVDPLDSVWRRPGPAVR